jgi:hypothetical protein
MSGLLRIQYQINRLKATFKIRIKAIERQLKDSRGAHETKQIQENNPQFIRTNELAIRDANIDQTQARDNLKKQVDDKNSKHTVHRAEVKNRALQEWINAGGDPSQFENAYLNIEPQILNERVFNALSTNKNPQ